MAYRTISVLVAARVSDDGDDNEQLAQALEVVAAEARAGARSGEGRGLKWASVDPGGGPPDPGIIGKSA